MCNEIIYFDSVKRLEKSRPNLVKLLWEKEFSEEESYEEFAKKERQLLIEREEKLKSEKDLEPPAENEEDDASDIDTLILNPETEFKIVDLGTAQYTVIFTILLLLFNNNFKGSSNVKPISNSPVPIA